MKKLILLLFLVPVLSACTDYGKKVIIKKSEVYYKGDNVTEAEAKELGKYLVKAGWFDEESTKSAQLTKKDETYIVRLVVDEEKVNNQVVLTMWKFQYDISEEVFDKNKVKIVFADSKMQDIKKQLDPIARLKVEKNSIWYNSKKFKKDDAKKLADNLVEKQYFSGENPKDILLTMEKDVPVVRFIVNKDLISEDEDKFLPIFSYWKETMSESVFDGTDVKVVLTTAAYEDFNTIKKLTAKQREAIQKSNTSQVQDTQETITTESTTVSGVERFRD